MLYYCLQVLSHEQQCLLQAQAAALRQVGRGGLNEQAGSSHQDPPGLEEGLPAVQRRGDATAVSTAEIVRHPSETEQVLRILATHLRGLKHLPPQTGWFSPVASLALGDKSRCSLHC